MSAFLGLLLLDTRFTRAAGDAGRPDSYAMPVRAVCVRGATPQRVLRKGMRESHQSHDGHEGDPALLQSFIDAALSLQADGAAAITTSCGFLVLHQAALQAALRVPVWTSSLLKLPELNEPGVLTVDAALLSSRHLQAAGASTATPVEGLEAGCSLYRTLLGNLLGLDAPKALADVVGAATRLVQRHPQVRHVVLECTNMPPYADAVARATGLPVHHLLTLVHERWKAP